MNYKKNRCKPSLFSFFFLCFGLYLLAQLRIEYIAIRPETNSWQTLKTASNTVFFHGLSVLSVGMIKAGTELARIKNNFNNETSFETSNQTLTHEQTLNQNTTHAQEHLTPNAQEIHKKIFATQEQESSHKEKLSKQENHESLNTHYQEIKSENNTLEKEEEKTENNSKIAANTLDPQLFTYIDTLENQLTSAQKYILREEAVDYSDHTINVLSEEIKSLKSYANYIETEYGNEHHKEVFHRKLLTLVNKSEQLLTAITEELTGIDQAFQPSSSIDAGIEHNKTILAQLKTQLS